MSNYLYIIWVIKTNLIRINPPKVINRLTHIRLLSER